MPTATKPLVEIFAEAQAQRSKAGRRNIEAIIELINKYPTILTEDVVGKVVDQLGIDLDNFVELALIFELQNTLKDIVAQVEAGGEAEVTSTVTSAGKADQLPTGLPAQPAAETASAKPALGAPIEPVEEPAAPARPAIGALIEAVSEPAPARPMLGAPLEPTPAEKPTVARGAKNPVVTTATQIVSQPQVTDLVDEVLDAAGVPPAAEEVAAPEVRVETPAAPAAPSTPKPEPAETRAPRARATGKAAGNVDGIIKQLLDRIDDLTEENTKLKAELDGVQTVKLAPATVKALEKYGITIE